MNQQQKPITLNRPHAVNTLLSLVATFNYSPCFEIFRITDFLKILTIEDAFSFKVIEGVAEESVWLDGYDIKTGSAYSRNVCIRQVEITFGENESILLPFHPNVIGNFFGSRKEGRVILANKDGFNRYIFS